MWKMSLVFFQCCTHTTQTFPVRQARSLHKKLRFFLQLHPLEIPTIESIFTCFKHYILLYVHDFVTKSGFDVTK